MQMNYIIKTIILTTIFLAVIIIFIFRRRKERRNKTFDSVKEYHETYLKKTRMGSGRENGRNNYVTKYNSSEDYREKLDIHDSY